MTAMRAREIAHSRVLAAYLGAGLLFMLLPGTFLGVWNLLAVSAEQRTGVVSTSWLQAHGHAQVFGWVGSFILGIGLYAIPIARAGQRPPLAAAWTCWALWTTGVAMRWLAVVYGWGWRMLVPISAGLELAAFLIFFHAVTRDRPAPAASRLELWMRVVMTGAIGFAMALGVNLVASVWTAWRGDSPAIPDQWNQRFLALITWGVLAPFVWGFSTKWLPVLLGLANTRERIVSIGVAANAVGILLTLAGWVGPATGLFVIAVVLVTLGLRLFETPARPSKTHGVHPSFPAFVRIAYVWAIVAAALGAAAAAWDVSGGIWGASRHAFTVGFISVMVFSIGQRVLPAFAAAGPLWSPRLMFAGLLLLTIGCALRVSSEIAAYQYGAAWAWSVLPASAILELTAVAAFALNMIATFVTAPARLMPGDV